LHQPRMGNFDAISSGLTGLTWEKLSAFYKTMYQPARMMLVISGDVSSGEALNEVARLYAKVPPAAGAKTSPQTLDSSQNGFRYDARQGNIAIPRLLFGFHTVSEKNEDYRALEVLSAILGLGEGSVFNARLRDQKRWILTEETKLTAYRDFGYLSLELQVDPGNIDRSEIGALTEIELLKREEPTEADIARALAQLERSHWRRLENVTDRARMLARYESLGDWKRMDRYMSELEKVKASDVKRVANKYLSLQNCSLLEYQPVSAERRNLTTESVRRTFEGLLGPSTDQTQAERDKEVVLAVKFPPAASFKFSEVRYPFQIASILRGPDIFIREDHTSPVIDMGLFFPGGKPFEKKENAGITKLLMRLLFGASKNKLQFYRQLEIYGGQVQPVVTDDYFGLYFSILSKNFDEGFTLLQDAIKTPDFDNDEIARQKQMQVAEILGRKNSNAYPQLLINQALFKNFPYSLNSDGTEASLAGITADSLHGWYDACVKNRKPVVAVVGDTKGTSLASYFVQHFSGSRFQNVTLPEGSAKPLEKGESIEQNWSKNQSLILIGFQAPQADDEDGFAAAVLESYAGGLGLFSQQLRDRLGIAYAISLTYMPRLHGGSMIACAATNPGGEDAVLKELREAIGRVASDSVAYRNLKSALSAAVGAYGIRSQSRWVQIADVIENLLAGKGIEGYQNWVSGLEGVKEEDFGEVAKRIFKLDKAVIVRLRGQSD